MTAQTTTPADDPADLLHQRLRQAILATISDGQAQPHGRIPSERELCERFGISRTTARRAISDLVHEGVLYTVTGKGTFVADRPLRQELRLLVGFAEDMRAQGIAVFSRVTDFRRIEADPALARVLNLRPYTPVVRLQRVRATREQPIAIRTSYLPEHLCSGILRLDFTDRSLFQTLRADYDLELVGGNTVIRAAIASAEEAALLESEPGVAVLRTDQVTLLADGQVIERCMASFSGAHFELNSTAPGTAPVAFNPVYASDRAQEG